VRTRIRSPVPNASQYPYEVKCRRLSRPVADADPKENARTAQMDIEARKLALTTISSLAPLRDVFVMECLLLKCWVGKECLPAAG
jgi:hypothetical protein